MTYNKIFQSALIVFAYTARKNYRPRRIAKIESVNSVKKRLL